MKLSEGEINKEYIIEKINIEETIKIRLEVLGITKGTKVKILNKRMNKAIIIKVRGTKLGISKKIANYIVVREFKKVRNNIEICIN